MQVYLFLSGMKRIVALIFSGVMVFSVAKAQEFNAALIVGSNFSQIDGDQLGGYNKLGLNAGLEISREVNEDWDAAFRIMLSMKGSKKVIDPEVFQPTLKISYHYVEVPLIAKYKGFGNVVPYGGVSLGVNIYNQRDDNGIITEEDDLRAMETALHIGADYVLNDKWNIGLKHSYSLLSIRNQGVIVVGPTWFGRAGWYNRLFTIGLTRNLNAK